MLMSPDSPILMSDPTPNCLWIMSIALSRASRCWFITDVPSPAAAVFRTGRNGRRYVRS